MTVEERVNENLGLVNMIVRRYLGRGTDYDDLFQIGAMGLVKAAQNFDESRELKFSTYAVSKIVGELKTYFRDNGSIKVARSVKEQLLKIRKAGEQLESKLDRRPTVGELAEATGLDPEDIVVCMEVNDNVLSLDKESEEGGSLYDAIGNDSEEKDIERIILKSALEHLDPVERQIIVMRYYMDQTQAQIANLLGMSQVSVSRKEKNILKKLAKMIS